MDEAGQKNFLFKDPGNGVDNYRPISCLPVMWNLSTGGVVSESTYNFLIKKCFCQKSKGDAAKEVRGQKITCGVI